MNRKLVLALSLFVLLCSSVYARFNLVRAKSSNGYAVAPPFTLTDIEGNIVALENLTGKIVVLDFLYPQCAYSDDQVVQLEDIYENYTRDELEIMSISPKEVSIQDLEEFKTGPNNFSDLEYDMSWIIARDTETQNVTAKYNISGYPTTVIIDQEGFLSPKSPFVGLTMASILSQEIEDIIPEFPSFIILPLFMLATLLAVMVYKRKHAIKQKRDTASRLHCYYFSSGLRSSPPSMT